MIVFRYKSKTLNSEPVAGNLELLAGNDLNENEQQSINAKNNIQKRFSRKKTKRSLALQQYEAE